MNPPWMLALTLAAAPAAAQGITLAEGNQTFTVTVLDERDPTAPGTVILEDIEFVDIDITGRTVLQDLDTTRPRRVLRDGCRRIELPGAARLMRYQRDGGLYHGFLWIPTGGLATVALERAGTGASGTESPFGNRIAISPDGQRAAVPLTGSGLELLFLNDGGRVAQVGFMSARSRSVTPGAPFLDAAPQGGGGGRFVPTSGRVVPSSLMLGTHAFFMTANERLWRLSMEDGSLPENVSPPAVPDGRMKDEMALSGDGSTLVFLYGPKEQQNLWLLRGSGPATVLPPPASKYEEPNYLPAGPGQPRMLLNGDGTRLLYTENAIRDEIFLLDLSLSTPHQLTGDDNFEPYIGAVILPFFRAGTVLMAVGDPDRMDWFIADATPGHIANLTRTGSTAPPFAEGTLAPENAILTPGSLLVTERTTTGDLRLRCMTAAAPQGQILYDDLLGDLVAGSRFGGQADFLAHTVSGDRLLDGSTGTELLAVPAGVTISPPATGPENRLSVFRAKYGGLEAAVFHLRDGTLVGLPPVPGLEQVVLTSDGGALLNGDTLRYLRPRVDTVIPTSGAVTTLVLSGIDS